jgi:hypothetical protein
MAKEYELSLDPSKRQPKVDVKKSAKKAEANEAARLEAMRARPVRDTSKDFKFKYDGNNADHKELLGHLMNNGLADDIVVDDKGVASFPRRTFIKQDGKEVLQPLMQKMMATNLAKRPSNKTAAPGMRPAAPLPPRNAAPKKETNSLIEDRDEVMRNLFGK